MDTISYESFVSDYVSAMMRAYDIERKGDYWSYLAAAVIRRFAEIESNRKLDILFPTGEQ